MAHIRIFACAQNASITANDELPSPVSLQPTSEQIWSEDTGRAQEEALQAKMIGKVIAEKMTYAIKWGVLTPTQFASITSKLTSGFFKFGVATGNSLPTGAIYYRSEIAYDMIQAGSGVCYKDVSVSVIEQ